MISISIKADVSAAIKALTDVQKKQVAYAAAQAVNALAFQVQRAERKAMTEVFTHPRPFTQRSVMVTKATKANQTATVYIKPDVAKYLAPYEFGGQHFMPGKGLTILNPKNLRLDAYGQIRGRPRDIGNMPGVFVGTITFKKSGQTVSGMWQRPQRGVQRAGGKGTKGALRTIGGVKTGLKLLLRFGEALTVKKRLEFEPRARALVAAQSAKVFAAALDAALKSAR